MSFNPLNFIISRSSNGQLPIRTSPSLHFYGTKTDTLATCMASGYFNFLIQPPITANYSGGFNDNLVLVGDYILCHATDNSTMLVVTSITAPFTVSAQFIPPNPADSGSFSLTFSGPWAAPQTSTVLYAINNGMISLYLPILFAPATSGTFISSSTLPANLIPSRFNNGLAWVVDNGFDAVGIASVTDLGLILIGASPGNPNFTTPGDAGFRNITINYFL